MDAITFIRQALTQAHERLMATLGGLTDADATWRPAPRANTILEIAWHVARVDDRLGRQATGLGPELWASQGWSERLGTTNVATQLRHMITHKNNHHGQIDFIRGLRHPECDLTPGTGIVQR